MLKNILKLDGAQQLSKKEQKEINGGITPECADAWSTGVCVRMTLAQCNNIGGGYYCGKCC
jgi:hypothetical protein